MTMRLGSAGLLLAALFLGRGVASRETESWEGTLQERVNSLYRESVAECKQFYPGKPECVKAQFDRHYHWSILKDQDPSVGPPGTPGPPLNTSTSTPNQRQKIR